MQFHLGQALAADEFVIVNNVIAFPIPGPVDILLICLFLRQRGKCGDHQDNHGQDADEHLFPSNLIFKLRLVPENRERPRAHSADERSAPLFTQSIGQVEKLAPAGRADMSLTTLQLRGRMKNAQAAQLNKPLGLF